VFDSLMWGFKSSASDRGEIALTQSTPPSSLYLSTPFVAMADRHFEWINTLLSGVRSVVRRTPKLQTWCTAVRVTTLDNLALLRELAISWWTFCPLRRLC